MRSKKKSTLQGEMSHLPVQVLLKGLPASSHWGSLLPLRPPNGCTVILRAQTLGMNPERYSLGGEPDAYARLALSQLVQCGERKGVGFAASEPGHSQGESSVRTENLAQHP